MLAAIFTLVAVSAIPASAETGYYWARNRAGDCLDFSGQFGFRVFPCNSDKRYQHLYYKRPYANSPDTYQIRGNPDSGRPNTCISAGESSDPVSSNPCAANSSQYFNILYAANGWAYFDSVLHPGLCLTKSDELSVGGFILRSEPCAGRNEQYWVFL
ncbi:RICIN domain-containing protein [Umezawaea endophytica]|uniref:RICIN domain-containing protein n=1 Tax=Umezawaea endophytica TaxID=1654476 RepID=A0A9X3AII2_9PSEU|nr:RICIN domain-containing protein [Umezawaea endophytica]MCS7482551.1 RICIN domain-containing protein [Umezawaea endophytica]